jgi:hypothetical protein
MVVEKSFAQMLSVLEIYHHNFDKFRVCIRARSLAYFQARIFCFNSELTRRLKKIESLFKFCPQLFFVFSSISINRYIWLVWRGGTRTHVGRDFFVSKFWVKLQFVSHDRTLCITTAKSGNSIHSCV